MQRLSIRTWTGLASLLLVGASGCAGPPPLLTRAGAEARLAQDPTDAGALRDLGILFLQEERLGQAQDALRRSFDLQPADPETVYFLGITQEALGRTDLALRLYEQYPQLAEGPYRDKLRGRFGVLLREQSRADIRALLASDDTLASVAGTGAVAVVPFRYGGGNEQYAPLGRGFAEMISGDLAVVEGLTVVERLRLQALLAEFELARTGAVSRESAPQVGRLLRAERVVGGAYTVDREQLRVDASVYDGRSGGETTVEATEGGLSDLLRVQDALVLDLLVALGIQPTPEARALIERIPTENLQAFLAYSRGLEAEDAGDLPLALRNYAEAARLDPSFAEAVQRRDETSDVADQSGAAVDVAVASAAAAVQPSPDATSDVVFRRSALLAQTMGVQLVPSSDSRQPAVEGSQAGILGALPPPPPPPSTGNLP